MFLCCWQSWITDWTVSLELFLSKRVHNIKLRENFNAQLEFLTLRSALDFPRTQRYLDYYSSVSYCLLGFPRRFFFFPLSTSIPFLDIKLVFYLSCPHSPHSLLSGPASLNLLPLWVGCTSGSYFTGNHPAFHPFLWQVLRDINHLFQPSEESQSVQRCLCSQQTWGSLKLNVVVFMSWLVRRLKGLMAVRLSIWTHALFPR